MNNNGGAAADRLLLLASITEKDQQHATTVEEESSEEHTSHVVAKTNIADNIAAVEDEQGSTTKARPDAAVASNSTSIKRKSHEEPNTDNNNSVQQAVDPTTFTLNEDEDLMVQLRRSGLDQVKIPPLRQVWEIEEMVQNKTLSSSSYSVPSAAPAKKKRKISDAGSHPAASSSSHRHSPSFTMLDANSRMLNPSNYSALFPPFPDHYLNNNSNDGRVYGVGVANSNRGYGVLGVEDGGVGAAVGKSPFFLPNIVTGGSSPHSAALLRMNREEEEVQSNMMKRLPGILPAPPLISGGVVRSVSHGAAPPGGGGGGSAASSRALGHDYHKEIMSMSMAGLSQNHRMYYNMMNQPSPRLGPTELVQQQQSMRDDEKKKMNNVLPRPSTTAKPAASVESKDGPQENKTKKKEKKKLMIKHQLLLPAGQQIGAASPSPPPSPQDQDDSPQDQEDDCSPTTITTKAAVTKKDDTNGNGGSDSKPPPPPSVATFPNQEIFSQILREKQLKSRPSVPPPSPPLPVAAAVRAIQIAANNWDGQMTCLPVERDRVPVSSSSSLPKSKPLMKKSSDEAIGALPPSLPSKSAKKASNEESSSSRNVGAAYEAEARRRLQIELMLRQQEERKLIETLPEYSTAARMLMWQRYNDEQMMMNPSALPLPLPSQLKPHQSDQVMLSLLELENQVRSEEHYARICSQNTHRMMEIHHQASQLEQQMKLRELEFMRERRRLADIQAVNRLRLQADALEQRLLMYGGNGDDFDGVGRKK